MTSSSMDIYAGNYYPQSYGLLGWAEFWRYSTELDPNTQNWGWNKIMINFPSFNTLSVYHRKGTIAHEMGHAFGLAHSTNNSVIMAQYGNHARIYNTAQKDDLNGINYLYK